ncbi:hypothetical protein JZ751_024276, partial [Albula glossodonta]
MVGVSYTFSITYTCDGEEPKEQTTGSNSITADLCDLKPGVEYSFSICTVLHNGSRSRACSAQAHTHENSTVLSHLKPGTKYSISVCTVLQSTGLESELVHIAVYTDSCLKQLVSGLGLENCLLEELTLKVVLEIRNIENEPTNSLRSLPWCFMRKLMMMSTTARDESKGFVEQSIVLTELPLISFVRLGNSSLSKSHILNQILSNPQEYHDTFIHRNLTRGNIPRRISNGLVEISWYLPCGKGNMDIFPEPVAVANLRGDINAFDTQFSFLCKISAAMFVFCDDFQESCEVLNPKNIKAQLFLVCSSQNRSFSKEALKKQVTRLQIPTNHIILKTQKVNDAEFIKKLHVTVNDVIKKNQLKVSVNQMSAIAHELGIPVDEDYVHCQEAKVKVDAITAGISDILEYKQTQLPLQGEICKELAKLEREECRLKNVGDKNIEEYKSELNQEKQRFRETQKNHGMSTALSCFISALSGHRQERSYFLKWMKINLDHLSLKHLSGLREKYKDLCLNSPQNKELIAKLDRQIASSSLGVEHFLREMGQLYEVACSLPENDPYRQQMKNLPRYCAQLLLDGFPVELIDGDASIIPLQWVKDVLTELHNLTQSNNRIRVITVLGVQSSGKSTLLNTMFGVQFSVSSGKCTRGAFMILIRVQEDFRQQLGCDFIMVIDTEGLKSPELAQLADSYEHDNELATLVVGLSDITVINIAMENSTEMKDILQIVVHAFLRMKEVGKKPCCMFVHQNVADVSAHDMNLRDRKLLLEQLNEMTQAAARMEKTDENKKFTDVMEYDPERNTWYIPGLWHGTPPMAPVNAGYSETVSDFKSSIIEALKGLKKIRSAHTVPEFLEWTSSLWKAVKYENFIFSFQNSLVADAYLKLCAEFNEWDWTFRKHMHNWMREAETTILNLGMAAPESQDFSLDATFNNLKIQCHTELDKEEKQMIDNISEYYKRPEGHVNLVQKYKEDFVNSAKSLKMDIENSAIIKLNEALKRKKGMEELERMKRKSRVTIEEYIEENMASSITDMEEKQLKLITRKIKEAVVKVQSKSAAQSKEEMSIQIFIQELCTNLSELLVIPKDALDAVMLLNKAKTEQFSGCLLSYIDEMEQSLRAEFQSDDVGTRLNTLPFKPQDELFRRLFGCGKQCPFCRAP